MATLLLRPHRRPTVTTLVVAAAIALGGAACGGDEPSSVRPGLPGGGTTVLPTTTEPAVGGGATIVLPKGTSPPGSNPLAPGTTLAGSGSPHGGGASSGPAGADQPQIGEITVPGVVRCPQAGVVDATVDYRTIGADRVVFVVDGQQQPALAPLSGPTTVAVPCDDGTHVLVVAVVAPSGQTTIDTRVLVTRVDAPTEVQTGG